MGYGAPVGQGVSIALLVLSWPTVGLAGDGVRFEFSSPRGSRPLRLHAQRGWSADGGLLKRTWKEVCTSPCTGSLPAGKHRMALSLDDNDPVEVDTPIQLRESSTLRGSYTSRATVRTAGYVTMFLVPAVALLANTQRSSSCDLSDCSGSDDAAASYVWIGIGAAGFIGGIIMTQIGDTVSVTVTPLLRSESERG